jgi:protein-disulfide isomerase
MPWFGLLGFTLVAGALLARGPRARGLHLGLAGVGAMVGGFLLGVQLILGRICVYCTITDVAAILGLGVAWWRSRQEIDPPKNVAAFGLAIGLVASSVGTPAALGASMTPPIPAPILAELKKTPPGQVTIIDFVDFQCPYCRQTHGDLKPLLEAHPGKIRVVRKQVPLSMHLHARDAARASCCSDLLGRGDAMADELMVAPVEKLTPEGCAELAAKLGLDVQAFQKCLVDPATDKKIDEDKATFNAVGGEGLPTLWIDTARIEGAQGPAVLKQVLDASLAAQGS